MNRKNFLKLICFAPACIWGFKLKKRPRYIYAKEEFFIKCQPSNAFPYLVMAIDLEKMCGFTPQDWNWTWMPDENWKEVSWEEFFKISKKLNSITTHFRNSAING